MTVDDAARKRVEDVITEYLSDRHGTAAIPYARESGLVDKVIDALRLERVGGIAHESGTPYVWSEPKPLPDGDKPIYSYRFTDLDNKDSE